MDRAWLALTDEFFKGATLLAVGTVIGFAAKEFLFPRLFERWKAERALEEVYRKYRDPLVIAAAELKGRLYEICNEDSYPPAYLTSRVLKASVLPQRLNSADDLSFQKYRLISSVYRFCAFWGWVELYRQDIVLLDAGHTGTNRKFRTALDAIRSDLADGELNTADDWDEWKDRLLFREELRAIGDAVIVTDDQGRRAVMGYRRLCDIYVHNSEPERKVWIDAAAEFLLDLPGTPNRNFLLVRMKRLFRHIVELIGALSPDLALSDQDRAMYDRIAAD